MALTVKHVFTSGKPDGADASLIQPSHWNADHVVTGTAGGGGNIAMADLVADVHTTEPRVKTITVGPTVGADRYPTIKAALDAISAQGLGNNVHVDIVFENLYHAEPTGVKITGNALDGVQIKGTPHIPIGVNAEAPLQLIQNDVDAYGSFYQFGVPLANGAVSAPAVDSYVTLDFVQSLPDDWLAFLKTPMRVMSVSENVAYVRAYVSAEDKLLINTALTTNIANIHVGSCRELKQIIKFGRVDTEAYPNEWWKTQSGYMSCFEFFDATVRRPFFNDVVIIVDSTSGAAADGTYMSVISIENSEVVLTGTVYDNVVEDTLTGLLYIVAMENVTTDPGFDMAVGAYRNSEVSMQDLAVTNTSAKITNIIAAQLASRFSAAGVNFNWAGESGVTLCRGSHGIFNSTVNGRVNTGAMFTVESGSTLIYSECEPGTSRGYLSVQTGDYVTRSNEGCQVFSMHRPPA